tara:strand:+ start:24241 stop:25314 length:1074 start_codon:yes stop_codon:yes gene_type:complete
LTFFIIIFFIIVFNSFIIPRLISNKFLNSNLKLIRKRDIHNQIISPFGGIAIFFSFSFSILILILFDSSKQSPIYINFNDNYFIFFISSFFIFVLGFLDDLYNLSYIIKLSIQLLISYIFVFILDVYIESFYGLFDVFVFSDFDLKLFSVLVSVFIINSFNLIDGVDGLASSIGSFILISFGIIFYFNNLFFDTLICGLLICSLLSFLNFNLTPAKIFMGDSGSLFIGCFIAFFSLKICNLEIDASGTVNPVFILCILSYPSIDTIRIFTIRIINKKSPFLADKNHIHHLILSKTNNPNFVIVFAVIYTLLLMLLSYQLRFNITFSFIISILFSLFLINLSLSRYFNFFINFIKKIF